MSARLDHWIALAILAAAALVTARRFWIALRASRASAEAGACAACGCAEPAPTDPIGRRSGDRS